MGHVLITLINNSRREADPEAPNGIDEPNPRGPNPHGHLIKLIEDGDDPTSTTFRWNLFVKCGNPAVAEDDTKFGEVADPEAAGG